MSYGVAPQLMAEFQRMEFTHIMPEVEYVTEGLGLHPDPEASGEGAEIVTEYDGNRIATEDSVVNHEWIDLNNVPEKLALRGLIKASLEIIRICSASTVTPVKNGEIAGPTVLELTQQHGLIVYNTDTETEFDLPEEVANLTSPPVTIEFEPDSAENIKEVRFADVTIPSEDRLRELVAEQRDRLFWLTAVGFARIKRGELRPRA
jgi:hypothetical protein